MCTFFLVMIEVARAVPAERDLNIPAKCKKRRIHSHQAACGAHVPLAYIPCLTTLRKHLLFDELAFILDKTMLQIRFRKPIVEMIGHIHPEMAVFTSMSNTMCLVLFLRLCLRVINVRLIEHVPSISSDIAAFLADAAYVPAWACGDAHEGAGARGGSCACRPCREKLWGWVAAVADVACVASVDAVIAGAEGVVCPPDKLLRIMESARVYRAECACTLEFDKLYGPVRTALSGSAAMPELTLRVPKSGRSLTHACVARVMRTTRSQLIADVDRCVVAKAHSQPADADTVLAYEKFQELAYSSPQVYAAVGSVRETVALLRMSVGGEGRARRVALDFVDTWLALAALAIFSRLLERSYGEPMTDECSFYFAMYLCDSISNVV